MKRKKKIKQSGGPDLMERTRATVALINARRSDSAEKMYGFLSLFHPEMPDSQKRKLAR